MEQKKYTLLIDQDDVLAEYIKGVIKAYNHKYQTNFTADDCTSWDLASVFGEEIDTVMHEPDLFRHLEPVRDALQVFERLYRSQLFEIYIVTAANLSCVEAKSEWLKEHLPFFPEEQFIVCRRKYMIKGDFLLDDGMHNIEAFAQEGGIPVIFDRPHNRGLGKDYKRVSSWLEFEAFIMAYCCPEESQQEKEAAI